LDISQTQIHKVLSKFQPEVIYHLAAQKNVRVSVEQPSLDAQTNILGSLNLLEYSLGNKLKKFIFVSTAGVYGEADIIPTSEDSLAHPISPYGLTKLFFEKYLTILSDQKIPYVILRLANVYGPRQDPYGEAGVISIFIDNLIKGKSILINGDGLQTRDYLYVADVVEALVKSLDAKNVIYNIGTGKKVALLDLIDLLKNIFKASPKIISRPAIKGEIRDSCLDSSQARNKLSWQANYDLKKGLELTKQWFEQNQ